MIYLVFKVLYTSFGSTLNRHQPYHPNRKNDGFRSYLANTIGHQLASHMVRCESHRCWLFEQSRFQGGKLEKQNKCDLFVTIHMSPSKSLRHHLNSIENHHLCSRKRNYTQRTALFVGTKMANIWLLPYPPNTSKYLVFLFRLFTPKENSILSVPWLHAPDRSGLWGLWLTLTCQNITLLKVFHEPYVPS